MLVYTYIIGHVHDMHTYIHMKMWMMNSDIAVETEYCEILSNLFIEKKTLLTATSQ